MYRKHLRTVSSALCACIALALPCGAFAAGKPVRMVIEAPELVKPGGWLLTEGWQLTLSMEAKGAVAFITEEVSSGQGDVGVRQALVVDDPDGCLDASSFDPDGFPVEQGCAGEDETWFAFRYDPFDGPRIPESRCHLDSSSATLLMVDDAYNPGNVENLNKAYINSATAGPSPRPVGPASGGERDMVAFPFPSDDPAFDCYGFGADYDGVEGLIVWADIGPFKVLDADLKGTGVSGEVLRLRNGAGFTTSITSVLLDANDTSNVKATIVVPRALFEPLVAIDTDINSAGMFTAFDYLRQIDEGPIEGFNYEGGGTPTNVARARAISADLPPVRVTVKALLVEGPAPDFIVDMNGDGAFTRADIKAMGYTPLSNVARYRIRALRSYNFESGGDRCPPVNMLVAKDLDGADDESPPEIYSCATGSARSGRRVPR